MIESAADQRMAHLRAFQTGPRGELASRILNELATARVVLLNPQKKAAWTTIACARRSAVEIIQSASRSRRCAIKDFGQCAYAA